jgi:hypothetical protein
MFLFLLFYFILYFFWRHLTGNLLFFCKLWRHGIKRIAQIIEREFILILCIHICRMFIHIYWENRLGGVIVNVLASSVVNRGFEFRSGRTKDYTIGMCCFSANHAALRLGIGIMCPSGATRLSVDYCFSELALSKSNYVCWSSTKRTSSSSHWKLTCSRHVIDEKLLSWR